MIILLPWNTSYYIPLNAFHPLYSGILESRSHVRYIVPKRSLGLEQYRRLLAGGVYENYFQNKIWWLKSLPKQMQNKFYSFYSLREINYVDKLPGDIELLHTAPITAGNRDFIFHCESFLPIFMPFVFQGGKTDQKLLLQIKKAYKNLFKTRCLAIVSHHKKTLDEISTFFDSPVIDNLIHHLDIGVTKSKQISYVSKKTVFLFVASAHQNSNNFLFRGGYIAINIALAILSQNHECKFIFRCARPNNHDLVENNIDMVLLESAEQAGDIIWLETRLPQHHLDKLMAQADFLLLPSASLHSDSVLSAMQYQTIPVVTDISGYKIYLNNDCAVILEGVQKETYDIAVIGDTSIGVDNYETFANLDFQQKLAVNAAEKVSDLLKNKEKINELKDNLLKFFQKKFRGDTFINKLELLIKEKNIKIMDEMMCDNELALGESFIEDLSTSWFDTCPQPLKLANTGHGTIRKTFKDYLYVPYWREGELTYLESFSLLNYVHEQHSESDKGSFVIKNNFTDLIIPLINIDEDLYKPTNNSNQSQSNSKKLHFKYILAGKLRRYPRLFSFAQKIYRYSRMKGFIN